MQDDESRDMAIIPFIRCASTGVASIQANKENIFVQTWVSWQSSLTRWYSREFLESGFRAV